ncbi:MAG: hypothetical protein Q9193_006130, partial [Seirophora villosa]
MVIPTDASCYESIETALHKVTKADNVSLYQLLSGEFLWVVNLSVLQREEVEKIDGVEEVHEHVQEGLCYLLSLVSIKQSNLCVSADVHTTSALLRLAEEVGDSICVLKTHVDIIDDFSDRTIKGLQEIAKRKYFLIFEDRKFGDIG